MKLCISTVVDSKYQAWMPIFIYCCKTQYPEYCIRIFTSDRFTPQVLDALELIPDEWDWVVVDGYFDDYHKHQYSPISWRFAIDRSEYQDYDYVYITDIDMMILREPMELLYFHLNEMQQTGLCYSNSLRNKGHWKGYESLTGLHFASKEFFERTNDVMKKYAEKLKTGEVGEKREYDGHMLYNIVKESGLGMVGKYKLVPRHHGIHMGNFRLFERQKKLRKRIDVIKCQQWSDMLCDETFRKIIKLCSYDPVVKKQMAMLEFFCRKSVR